jgi:hypothetical protein
MSSEWKIPFEVTVPMVCYYCGKPIGDDEEFGMTRTEKQDPQERVFHKSCHDAAKKVERQLKNEVEITT